MKRMIVAVAILFGTNGFAQTIESPLKMTKSTTTESGVWYKDKNKGKLLFGDMAMCQENINSILTSLGYGLVEADYIGEFNGHEMKMWYLSDGSKLILTSSDTESMLLISNMN
jgi:hypothetical protein